MVSRSVLVSLDRSWDSPNGFLFRIRSGCFDAAEGKQFVELLHTIALDDDAAVSQELVRLLWFLPLFLEWQQERIDENSDNPADYRKFTSLVFDEVCRIFGVP